MLVSGSYTPGRLNTQVLNFDSSVAENCPKNVMSSWWWINNSKYLSKGQLDIQRHGAGCLWSVCVCVCRRYMFILDLSDREHSAKGPDFGDRRHHVRALLATVGATNKDSPLPNDARNAHQLSHHHLQRGPTTLQQEPGTSPAERVSSAEPGFASSKTQRPLETHSCCYLTQRLDTAQQLRSSKLQQLNWKGSEFSRLIECGGALGLNYYLHHSK